MSRFFRNPEDGFCQVEAHMVLTSNINGTDQTMPLLFGYSINRFSHDVVCM